MYNQVELKLSLAGRFKNYKDGEGRTLLRFLSSKETEAGIEFESVNKMRKFINDGQRIFKIQMKDTILGYESMYTVFKVVKIHKIKHKKIEATIQKMTLRDYNLDTILEAI